MPMDAPKLNFLLSSRVAGSSPVNMSIQVCGNRFACLDPVECVFTPTWPETEQCEMLVPPNWPWENEFHVRGLFLTMWEGSWFGDQILASVVDATGQTVQSATYNIDGWLTSETDPGSLLQITRGRKRGSPQNSAKTRSIFLRFKHV